METADPRMASRSTDAAWPAVGTQPTALEQADASRWWRWIPERWVTELLAVGFALLLVGTAAVCGLAVMSGDAPTSRAATARDSGSDATAIEPR